MIGVALFGIFLTPVFFFVLMWFGSHKQVGTASVFQPAAFPSRPKKEEPANKLL
jgi:hypothetical protein